MDPKISFLDRLNQASYLNLNITQWLVLIGLTIAIGTLARFALRKVMKRLQAAAHQTSSPWDDVLVSVLQKTNSLFLFILAFYTSAMLVGAPESTRVIFYKAVVIGTFFQAAIWGNQILEYSLRRYLMHRNHIDLEEKVDLSAYSAISLSGKFFLWLVLLLLLLDNLGVNITALVTGLGIGGIAIALAMQNILGDIFSSLSIVLDRPFEIGDFIVVGDKSGTVENIGLKTSRIKSLSGEQLVFPNRTLIEKEISNFKRMQTRRIQFTFGVVYNMPLEKLRAIPGIIRGIIEPLQHCRLDRAHFARFGESSLDFEVVYIMQTADYNAYMDVQQDINLKIYEAFAAQGIEFAFPSRTVVVKSSDDHPTKTSYKPAELSVN